MPSGHYLKKYGQQRASRQADIRQRADAMRANAVSRWAFSWRRRARPKYHSAALYDDISDMLASGMPPRRRADRQGMRACFIVYIYYFPRPSTRAMPCPRRQKYTNDAKCQVAMPLFCLYDAK